MCKKKIVKIKDIFAVVTLAVYKEQLIIVEYVRYGWVCTGIHISYLVNNNNLRMCKMQNATMYKVFGY